MFRRKKKLYFAAAYDTERHVKSHQKSPEKTRPQKEMFHVDTKNVQRLGVKDKFLYMTKRQGAAIGNKLYGGFLAHQAQEKENRRIKEAAAARIAAAAEEHVAEADEGSRNTTHARSRPGRRMSTISALLADDAVARERWNKALYQDDTNSAQRKVVIEKGSKVRIVKVDHNHRKVAVVAKVKRKGMFEVRLVQEMSRGRYWRSWCTPKRISSWCVIPLQLGGRQS